MTPLVEGPQVAEAPGVCWHATAAHREDLHGTPGRNPKAQAV